MQVWYLFRIDYRTRSETRGFSAILLSLRRDLSLTPCVFRELMASYSPSERNLKQSYLEISETMPLVHYALSTYLERCCCNGEHSDGNVTEPVRTGTTFGGEYLLQHQVFQAILPLETFHDSSTRRRRHQIWPDEIAALNGDYLVASRGSHVGWTFRRVLNRLIQLIEHTY